jgi:lipoyl(octanoyl) transferase
VCIREFYNAAFDTVWEAMREFTDNRDAHTPDELWIVEHQPVYTLGQAGKQEHILDPGSIPVVKTDRGGQVTYHGPGQLVVYVLTDIRRKKIGVRQLVSHIEKSVISLLEEYQITAHSRCDAPGVYVEEAKICSIGLRIRRGCSYHGLALNINMDLSPFLGINPCGYQNLRMTQLKDVGIDTTPAAVAPRLVKYLERI